MSVPRSSVGRVVTARRRPRRARARRYAPPPPACACARTSTHRLSPSPRPPPARRAVRAAPDLWPCPPSSALGTSACQNFQPSGRARYLTAAGRIVHVTQVPRFSTSSRCRTRRSEASTAPRTLPLRHRCRLPRLGGLLLRRRPAASRWALPKALGKRRRRQ